MNRLMVAVGIVLASFITIAGCGRREHAFEPKVQGRVYGVFEVPDSEFVMSEMIEAGFRDLESAQLKSLGLNVQVRENCHYFAIPFDSITIHAGDQHAKSMQRGMFQLADVTVPPSQWTVASALGRPIPVEYLGLPSGNGVNDIYLFISRDAMQDVHVELDSHGLKAPRMSPFGHMGCTHCKYWPDCAKSLAAGIQWCWDEHRYNLSLNDPRRFCNGQPKSYLNGDGYNCSYFWGKRQCP